MSLHVNHIYLETSNAISNLEDCRKFLFSITKSVLVSSLAPKEEKEVKEEEKQIKEEEKEQVKGEEKEQVEGQERQAEQQQN